MHATQCNSCKYNNENKCNLICQFTTTFAYWSVPSPWAKMTLFLNKLYIYQVLYLQSLFHASLGTLHCFMLT